MVFPRGVAFITMYGFAVLSWENNRYTSIALLKLQGDEH